MRLTSGGISYQLRGVKMLANRGADHNTATTMPYQVSYGFKSSVGDVVDASPLLSFEIHPNVSNSWQIAKFAFIKKQINLKYLWYYLLTYALKNPDHFIDSDFLVGVMELPCGRYGEERIQRSLNDNVVGLTDKKIWTLREVESLFNSLEMERMLTALFEFLTDIDVGEEFQKIQICLGMESDLLERFRLLSAHHDSSLT